jgi:hypothetical protein
MKYELWIMNYENHPLPHATHPCSHPSGTLINTKFGVPSVKNKKAAESAEILITAAFVILRDIGNRLPFRPH